MKKNSTITTYRTFLLQSRAIILKHCPLMAMQFITLSSDRRRKSLLKMMSLLPDREVFRLRYISYEKIRIYMRTNVVF